jgi:hypothetical protein
MTRTVLSILRQAVEPMTTRDIALEMLVNRALNTEDQKPLALMTKRVGVALRVQRNNSVVRSANGPGQKSLTFVYRSLARANGAAQLRARRWPPSLT